MLPVIPNFHSLTKSSLCATLSNVFLKSRYITSVGVFWLYELKSSLIKMSICCNVECLRRKPNCAGERICDEVDDVVMYNSLKYFRNGAEQRYWSIVFY